MHLCKVAFNTLFDLSYISVQVICGHYSKLVGTEMVEFSYIIKYPPTFLGEAWASPMSIVISGVLRLVRLIEHDLRVWCESGHAGWWDWPSIYPFGWYVNLNMAPIVISLDFLTVVLSAIWWLFTTPPNFHPFVSSCGIV